MLLNNVEPRTKPEVKGIPQDDVRADFLKFCGAHRFNRAVSADGHKGRRFHDTVGKRDSAAAHPAALCRGFPEQFKLHLFVSSNLPDRPPMTVGSHTAFQGAFSQRAAAAPKRLLQGPLQNEGHFTQSIALAYTMGSQ
jgi:hypothetical protein